MDVGDQLEKIGVFLAKYRFVAVLKKLSMLAVPSIEIGRVASQKPLITVEMGTCPVFRRR